MIPEIKFCGLVRGEDSREAARLGAAYVGVVFAGGPRMLAPRQAAEVLDVAAKRPGVQRVGVFGEQTPDEIAHMANELRLDIVQLHGDPDVARLESVRRRFSGNVWGVLRLGSGELPAAAAALFLAADAVLVEGRMPGVLGGGGGRFDWEAVARPLARIRRGIPLVVAGGLSPDNVGSAIALLSPAVVDVSSGVERSPGVKDHARMRAFVDAVRRSSGAVHGS